MRLVLRRAREARGLLLAATTAALVAVALVTGLAHHNREAVDAGQRSLLAAAPAEERTLLISGAGGRDRAEYAERDRTVRDRFADGLAGVPVTVASARYGTGRELVDAPAVDRDGDDPVFATLSTLPDLAGRAELTSGRWPRPGVDPVEVTVPEKVASGLGIRAGQRVPVVDRSSEQESHLLVVGVWNPGDPTDPYWRLAPGVGAAAPTGPVTSYGPFVLDPADFDRSFPRSFSAAWLVQPDLAAVAPGRLAPVKQAVAEAAVEVPEAAGLGTSARSATDIDHLVDRLARADLVGRSALLTPLLLILVLGGYALVLVAALLSNDRRAGTALLRARGASRGQVVGLAVREAGLVVFPAVLLAPPLAGLVLRHLGGVDTGPGPAVAVVTGVGALLALVVPALRRAGTYVADLASRSRPRRGAAVQRAGVDLALVGSAALAWFQLRQYSGPLAGADGRLGIDPLLASAPILGVLAGAVVALRLLPPATRVAERLVDRRQWTATVFGMWQAGRRPHAGPVLLLALAVGGSTLSWSLLSTWETSRSDQADHTVGADLRVVERGGVAPVGRAGELAALDGVGRALPAWRDELRLGRGDLPVAVVGLDAAGASGLVRLDDRLADEPVTEMFDRLVRARGAPAGIALPAEARQLTGVVGTPVREPARPHRVTVSMLLTTDDGQAYRLPMTESDSDGRPTRVTVDLPDTGGAAIRLVGFAVDAPPLGDRYRLTVADLATVDPDGTRRAASVDGGWVSTDGGEVRLPATATAGTLGAEFPLPPKGESWWSVQPPVRFSVLPDAEAEPVPALLTPGVRAALSLRTGETVTLGLPGASLPVRFVGEVDAVPTTGGDAILLDLPAAVDRLARTRGVVRPVPQWWVRADAPPTAVRSVADLSGVTVVDRIAVAETAARDPYWRAARTGLLAAAFGAVLLALVGLAVDVWATARHRSTEFAVLHTLGGSPRLLARALLAEQTFLAGLGVGVGVLLGALVGAATAPLVIVTPTADRPIPEAVFHLPWLPVGVTSVGLLLAALACSAVVATGLRQRMTVARLRIGAQR
ncbi:FtsX-like permease family protein [Micromonospora sp. NPDC000207]|uniref:FtsX-like permease family protein n=1 Tax=Micromonospora sp. NPDC000207 TaxID=3154246 RepID=UPI0033330FC4